MLSLSFSLSFLKLFLLSRSISVIQEVCGEEPHTELAHTYMVGSDAWWNHWIRNHSATDRLVTALKYTLDAYEMRVELLGTDHPLTKRAALCLPDIIFSLVSLNRLTDVLEAMVRWRGIHVNQARSDRSSSENERKCDTDSLPTETRAPNSILEVELPTQDQLEEPAAQVMICRSVLILVTEILTRQETLENIQLLLGGLSGYTQIALHTDGTITRLFGLGFLQ